MDTPDTQSILTLPLRIINCYEKTRGAMENFVPEHNIKDIRFFISSPDVSPTDKTNIHIACSIGKLSATATGINALLLEIIWLCVVAKDMYIKGFPSSTIVDCVDRIEKLLEAAEIWRIANLNY